MLLGDIVGPSGRKALTENLPDLIKKKKLDFVVVNGERRANAAKDYLLTYGVSGGRITVISYGKERPVNSASTPVAWSQNRRSATVKAN